MDSGRQTSQSMRHYLMNISVFLCCILYHNKNMKIYYEIKYRKNNLFIISDSQIKTLKCRCLDYISLAT